MVLTFTPSGRRVPLPAGARALAEEFASPMMDAHELLHLAGALAAYSWDAGGIVVEIGAYEGRTTVFMARILGLLGRRVPILSIDPFERAQPDELNPRGHYATYLANVARERAEDRCLPLVAFSRDAAAVVPEKIAVLVIDGAHHYEAVQQDFTLYGPKILPGGLMFVDDYVPAYAGVMRAADEYFASASAFATLHVSYFLVAQRSP